MAIETSYIERGVPIPRMNPRSELAKTFLRMKIGDSFVTNGNIRTVYSHANYYGVKINYRKLSDGRYRVWRTE